MISMGRYRRPTLSLTSSQISLAASDTSDGSRSETTSSTSRSSNLEWLQAIFKADIGTRLSSSTFIAIKRQFEAHHIDRAYVGTLVTDQDLIDVGLDNCLVSRVDRRLVLARIKHWTAKNSGEESKASELTTDERIMHASLLVCGLGASGTMLIYLRFLLIPLILGVFMAYFLQPIVDIFTERPMACGEDVLCESWCTLSEGSASNALLEKSALTKRKRGGKNGKRPVRYCCKSILLCRVPRGIAVIFAFTFVFMMLIVTGMLVSSNINEMTKPDKLADYERKIEEMKLDLNASFGINITMLMNASGGSGMAETLLGVAAGIGGTVADMIMVLLFAAYMVMEEKRFLKVEGKYKTLKEIDASIRLYITWKILLSGVTGTGCFLILSVFGIDMAALFALLTFLLNFVPIVGSVIAGMIVLPVVLLQPDLDFVIGFTGFMLNGSWNSVIGNVVEPIVFGDKFDMHEVTVLAALTLWGVIWGISGAVLSVPITVIILICLKSSKHPMAQLAANTLRGKFDDEEEGPEGQPESEHKDGDSPPRVAEGKQKDGEVSMLARMQQGVSNCFCKTPDTQGPGVLDGEKQHRKSALAVTHPALEQPSPNTSRGNRYHKSKSAHVLVDKPTM